MKRTIAVICLLSLSVLKAQVVADFESFTLTPNSYYKDTNSVDWQTTNAVFQYDWNKNFSFWSAGYSYTNMNDSVNGSYTNLYGCKPLTGYNSSAKYVTGQDGGKIKLKAPQNTVLGFYVTNSTYAHKIMQIGDTANNLAKKFGGTSGNDPDWFKITVKGYQNGSMKPDSAEFYLADYRFSNNSQDYIVKNWQWFNTSGLGVVDSIKILMYSSDKGSFGINTPAFFCMDNFTTSQIAGINELSMVKDFNVYPVPASEKINLRFTALEKFNSEIKVYDILGKEISSVNCQFNPGQNNFRLNIGELNTGIYFVELNNQRMKFIKN